MVYPIISRLPFGVLYPLSTMAAFLLYHVFRYRRQVSQLNLAKAFPEKPLNEIRKLQKSAYLHLTDSFLETLKANTINEEELTSRVTLANFDSINQQVKDGKSLFLLTAHTAPIDWVAFAIHLANQCNIDPVYKPVHSDSLDRFIFAIRSRYQGTPIPYKKLAKDVILRKNVHRCIALLADLEPRSRDHALSLEFLNQPTRFFLGSERIVRLAGLPTYFIAIKKLKRGHYLAEAIMLAENPKDIPPEELTRKYASCVEKTILENPAAWLWTHKRWKQRAI